MNVEAQKPNWHTGGMLPLCARRRNATGSIIWILSAKSLSTFISGEAWKINGLGIDFLTPSFNKHTQPPLHLLHPFCNLCFLISGPPLVLLPYHFCALTFISLTCLLSLSFTLGIHDYSLYIRIEGRGVGKKRLFQIPLCYYFPGFLRGSDSIAACWWGWQWHLKIRLRLDASLFSRIPIPLNTAALNASAI